MGYSARYHAASLAAVFLALAVGIVIGAGLGDDVLSNTEDNLRESLESDIEDARGEADTLQSQLDRERDFSASAYPALAGGRLDGRRIGVLAFGDLPGDVSADIEDALEPTGAELATVAVVRAPPEEAVADANPRRLGAQFVNGGGKLLDRLRDRLFLRSSGQGGPLDGVVLVRAGEGQPGGEEISDDERATESLETGMIAGIRDSGASSVAVERSGVAESSVDYFSERGVATVDSVDLTSGQVALVFALLGAQGNFGVKDTANALLPELLAPARGK